MLKIGGKDVDTLYVGSRLVQQVYKGSKKVYPDYGVVPKQIKDSMVLWYDIGRQGATNENMAENPVLKDLSGNGHDATCYNFAWGGMSGVGGYNWDFNKFIRPYYEHTSTTIIFKYIEGYKSVFEDAISPTQIGDTIYGSKIKVTGISGTGSIVELYNMIVFKDNQNIVNYIRINNDGEYEIPAINSSGIDVSTVTIAYCGFRNIFLSEGSEFIVEQLPLYPNALVSDGKDDYCFAEGLPILTDYTIIAKREWFDEEIDSKKWKCFCASNSNDDVDTTFILETKDALPNHFSVNSFGRASDIELERKRIVYMTKSSYNGTFISTGNKIGNDNLFLFIQKMRNGVPDRITRIAFYSLLLFDRTLTNDEIEWVKTNLIEGD